MKADALLGDQANRTPFVAAVLGTLPALLLVASGARADNASRWMDIGVDAVLLGAALAIWCSFRRAPAAAFVVLVGTPLLPLLWRLAKTCASLLRFHEALEHFRNLASLDVDQSVVAVGPWLVGAAYAAIAAIALGRTRGVADARDRNALRASAWVAVVGLAACLVSLERVAPAAAAPVSERPTSDSAIGSVGYGQDPSAIAVFVSAETAAVGVALMARAALRRRARRAFLAKVARGESPDWKIRRGDEGVAALLDPAGDCAGVLVALAPVASDDPYRTSRSEQAVGRI